MTIEEALKEYLEKNGMLIPLHGGRVYVMRLPQTAILPAVTYQRITTEPMKTHDMSGSSNLYRSIFQIDCWSTSYSGVKVLLNEVVNQLNGFKGIMGSGGGIPVNAVLLDNLRGDYQPETAIYNQSADFVVWYKE